MQATRQTHWFCILLLIFGYGTIWGLGVDNGNGRAQETQAIPQFNHLPVTTGTEGRAIRIEAQLFAPGQAPLYVRVYFRVAGESTFRHETLRPSARGFVGEIPGRFVRAPNMQYFLLALFNNGTVMTYPTQNPYGQPFEIIIRASDKSSKKSQAKRDSAQTRIQNKSDKSSDGDRKKGKSKSNKISPQLMEKLRQLEAPKADKTEPGNVTTQFAGGDERQSSPIIILSPEPASEVATDDALVAASFAGEVEIDSSSIEIIFDGNEVTDRAEVSQFLVSFNPGKLKVGEHEIIIAARDLTGKKVGPRIWQFNTVAGAETIEDSGDDAAKSYSGVAFAETRHEKFGGIPLDLTNVGGNISGRNGALSYNASMFITSLENQNFQPRNRFVLSAGVPWLNVTLGDATPYFNELILWGRRVRGVQAQLYTGYVNVDFVRGQTVREVTPAPGIRTGAFNQTLLGVRPYFGTRSFQVGLMFMKARDDTTSINADSTSITPRDNFVVGADMLMTFDQRRIEFKAAVAHSWITNNIREPIITKAYIDSVYETGIPFDPAALQSYLIINETTTPLDPRGNTALAYQLNLRLNYWKHFINIGLRQIGSQFATFGHTFLRNDIRGFYINDRFSVYRNRIFVNVGFERLKDHFNNVDNRPRTDLNTFNYGLTMNWGPGVPSLFISIRNHNRNNGVDTLAVSSVNTASDTMDTRQNNRTRDVMLTLSQELQAFDLNHTVSLSLTNSNRLDRFGATRLANAVSGDVTSNLRSVTWRTRFNSPLITTLSYASNNNAVGNQQGSFKYNMLNMQAEYRFPRPEIRAHVGVRRVSASGRNTSPGSPSATIIDYTQTGIEIGGSAVIAKKHEIVLDLGLFNYSDNGGIQTDPALGITQPNPSFTNKLLRLYYEFRF